MSLKSQNISERWFAAIGGANGHGEKVLRDFITRVQEAGIPGITAEKKNISTGLGNAVKSIFRGGGGSNVREMIEIKNETMAGWIIYAGARDYGKQLLVSWYLVVDEKELPRLARAIGGASMMELDIFQTEELSAFVTLVHEALKSAVNDSMKELNLDFTKVNTHTHGFLNIS